MYRILMSMDLFSMNPTGVVSLLVGYVLATAVFVLGVCPLHNYVQARVARSNGDDWVADAGYLTMNPRKSFHWIGLLSTFVVFMGFTKRVRYRRRYFDAPVLGTLWLCLSGVLTYFVCSVFFIIIYTFVSRFNTLGMTTPTLIPTESLSFFGSVFHSLFSMLFFLSRMCIYSAMFNLIPIPPMDMGDMVFTFLGQHWSDVIKKNDTLFAVGLFILAFFVLGMPDSFIANTSLDFINSVSNAVNFVINYLI